MSSIRKVMKNFSRNAELDAFLKNEIGDAGYGGVDVLKTPVGTKITLFVTKPGIVIGRRGVGIRSLTENIEKKFEIQNPQISVLELDVPELYPQVMCNRIAHNVSRGTAFRRAALWALNSIMNAGALGTEICIAGKLRSERAHFEKHRAGIVPKSGETAKRIVRAATQDVQLKMGLYGIKVRIAIKDVIPPEVEIRKDKQETVSNSVAKETIIPDKEVKLEDEKIIGKKVPEVELKIKEQSKNEDKIKKEVETKLQKPKVERKKRIKKSLPKVKLENIVKDEENSETEIMIKSDKDTKNEKVGD